MGNCLKLKPVRTWVDDDEEEDEDCYMKQCKEEEMDKKEKMAVKAGQTAMITREKQRIAPRSGCSTKMKIKLTKKQFEELMELVEMHGLQNIEQALISHQYIFNKNIDVVHSSDQSHANGCQRVPWRPVLQCIPEELVLIN